MLMLYRTERDVCFFGDLPKEVPKVTTKALGDDPSVPSRHLLKLLGYTRPKKVTHSSSLLQRVRSLWRFVPCNRANY